MFIGADTFEHAKRHPAKPAIKCDGQELNWQELEGYLSHVRSWISENSAPGSGIAISLPNSLFLPVLAFAIAQSGREAQILEPAWPAETSRKTISSLGSRLLISSEQFDFENCRNIIIPADPTRSDINQIFCPSKKHALVPVSPSASFLVGFTSGSTGLPKGYRRNHSSWIESFRIEATEFGHSCNDVILAPGSLTHSLFLYAVFHALHIGATAVISRQFRPDRMIKLAHSSGATLLYAVPAQLLMIARSTKPDAGFTSRTVRWVVSSGSKWNSADKTALLSRFPDSRFAEFYGASELSFITIAKDDEAVPDRSVGRAFRNVDIRICNQDGTDCSPGETGIIFVRSPMLFDGYANLKPTETIQENDQYYSVGDHGYLDSNNFLFLQGRIDRMIVCAGKNLYPEEIEIVLADHPLIKAVAVLPEIDKLRGTRPVGLVALAQSDALRFIDIIAYARKLLPDYKVPRAYFIVENWPRLHSGKTDFQALARGLSAGHFEPIR